MGLKELNKLNDIKAEYQKNKTLVQLFGKRARNPILTKHKNL